MFLFIFLFIFSNSLFSQTKPEEKEFIKDKYKINKLTKFESIKKKNNRSKFKVNKLDFKNPKVFYSKFNKDESESLELGKAFLVHRKDSFGYFVAVANVFFVKVQTINNEKFFMFSTYIKKLPFVIGDDVSYIGKPTDKKSLANLMHSLMDYSNLSRELGDFYFGSMSISFSYGISSLSTSSSGPYDVNNPFDAGDIGSKYSSDINQFKNYNSYLTYNMSFRWWFFFLSSLGMDIDYSFTPTIPTTTFLEQQVGSSFKGYGLSLLYRRKFFRMPAIMGIKYFSDSFKTANDDDYLLSSTYSGININLAWHFPYKFTILPLSFFKMVFHDFELGLGLSPIVFASDTGFSRGNRPSITSYRLGSGILFNFESKYLDFLKDFFFGIKYEYVSYSLAFSGITDPSEAMPDGTISKETYSYIGLQVKYEFNDPFGD